MNQRRDQRGVTIVELLVVIIMIGMLTTIITAVTINYWRYGYLLQADLDTLGTRLNAGDILRSGIAPSTGMIMQNSLPDAHPNNGDPADATGQFWLPIHAIPGNMTIPAAGQTTPLVYYSRPSLAANGSIIMNGTQPYEDEFVLYLDGSSKSLKQRALANPNATGNRLKTTCPAVFVSASCPKDKVVATDLASIDMRYFSRTGNLINYTSSTDPVSGTFTGPDFTAVEVIEFKLNLTVKPLLQKTNATSNTTIIRIALRNA